MDGRLVRRSRGCVKATAPTFVVHAVPIGRQHVMIGILKEMSAMSMVTQGGVLARLPVFGDITSSDPLQDHVLRSGGIVVLQQHAGAMAVRVHAPPELVPKNLMLVNPAARVIWQTRVILREIRTTLVLLQM